MQNNPLAKIYHFSSFWKRQEKYDLLNNTEFSQVQWQELELKEPYYFFVPKDFWASEKYNQGFSVSEIFREFNSWIQTKNDKLSIQFERKNLENIVSDFQNLSEEELAKKYDLKNTSWWNILDAKNDLLKNNIFYTNILYRPFDLRNSLFTWKSSWFIWRPREKESKYMLEDNICLFTTRTVPWNQDFNRVFIWKNISEIHVISDQTYFFPLYLYKKPEETQTEIPLSQRGQGDYIQNEQVDYQSQRGLGGLLKDNQIIIPPTPFEKGRAEQEKIPNFNSEIIAKIEEKLWLKLIPLFQRGQGDYQGQRGQEELQETFTPENLFDYIYAVLHSQKYREAYKEFLKIDFPKIPFDCNKETFFEMAKLWEELRSYHLLENPELIPKNFITKYEIDWDNKVEKVSFSIPPLSKGVGGLFNKESWPLVKINESQYFEWVPENVWNFYIWWYQPAQKWLKDRKDKYLNYEDILHYSKIILSLEKTIEIMKEIDLNDN